MKKLILLAAIFGVFLTTTSCEDILETESEQIVFDPALDQKTDSMFYTLAILKSVQLAIDQNVLINEMRGDLTETNMYTQTDLRELANFSATAANKYDSAYVYYRIINNCNYYIAHRDTMLMTGSTKVAIPEYVEALAVRAWAYMQLCKHYGTVDFYTTPITSISEANAPKEKKDMAGIANALLPELAQYKQIDVPNYGEIDAGSTNFGVSKKVNSRKIMFPVLLVMGDIYLETNQYEQAAKCYFEYLNMQRIRQRNFFISPSFGYSYPDNIMPPMSGYYTVEESWSLIFTVSPNVSNEIITYVPMAVNGLRGTTTNLPKLFGYNYYTTDVDTTDNKSQTSGSDMYILEREIEPSQQYINLCNSQDWYYRPSESLTDILTSKLGDLRRQVTVQTVQKGDSAFRLMTKYNGGNINIYRASTVYLRLAEALNRMGYPDAAFMILKDGMSYSKLDEAGYLKPETIEMLTTTIPFFSEQNMNNFTTENRNIGIHSRGANETEGQYSPYQYVEVLASKLAELKEQGVNVQDTPQDSINAMEDIICDEMAMELAFEGNRFADLTRIAKHKNADPLYGSNYGSLWLARKLAYKNPVKDLTQEINWYLPMK